MATFRVGGSGPGLTAGRVTAELELQPSRCIEVGDARRPGARPADIAMWSLSSSGDPLLGRELEDSITEVLDQLHPRRRTLWSLADAGYAMDWFCYLGSHATEHAAELSRAVMQRLLSIPGDLLLDVYEDHPDDD